MFTCRPVVFCIITCFIGTINITFFGAYIVNIFDHIYDISEDVFGYILSSLTVTYVIGCMLMPHCCEHLPRRFLFMVCILGFAVTLILFGPSKMFPTDNKILPIIAFPLLGIFQVGVFIPIIPEIYDRLKVHLKIQTGDEIGEIALNNKVNDTYGFFYALSMFAGPNIGTQLAKLYNPEGKDDINANRGVSDVMVIVNLVWFFILFFFNGFIYVFQENKELH